MKIELTLKDIYKIAYDSDIPFEEERDPVDFYYALFSTSAVLNGLINNKETTFIDVYMYLLHKLGLNLDDLYLMFLDNLKNKNMDSLLYRVYNKDELFAGANFSKFVLNKLGIEPEKCLKEPLAFNLDFIALCFTKNVYDKILKQEDKDLTNTKYGKMLTMLLERLYNIKLKEVPVFIKEFLEQENISVGDVEEAIKEIAKSCDKKFDERIKDLIVDKTRAWVNTKTPAERESYKLQLKNMFNNMQKIGQLVFGQDEAIKKVKSRILSCSAGFRPENQPIASFLLTGPTGVGKTETAKSVANACFDGKIYVVDMSTYKNKGDVTRLLGAAPSYVGYDDKNAFCDFILENPNSVILFDEIEKADSECLDLLMRILDEGQFINAKGHVVDMQNNIIFCTTNLTQNKKRGIGFDSMSEKTDEAVAGGDGLRKELVGRFSDVIEYKKLTKQDCKNILKNIFMEKLIKGFHKNNQSKISLMYTEQLLDQIVESANTDLFGARDLRKSIQNLFIDPISYYLVENSPSNTTLLVDADGKITEYKSQKNTKKSAREKQTNSQSEK